MEENGRKWKEMGKSVVDVQIEGVLAKILLNWDTKWRYRIKIDHPKLRYKMKTFWIQIDHTKDIDTI